MITGVNPSLGLTRLADDTWLALAFYLEIRNERDVGREESSFTLEVCVHPTLILSSDSRMAAGILLLTIVAIEYGGWFVLRIVRGRVPMTEFQKTFARAGHAHAGVLVILALVGQILVDATSLSGPLGLLAHDGIWASAILMPAGFFFSSAGRDVTVPNRLILLLYLGVLLLTLGVVSLAVGLLH